MKYDKLIFIYPFSIGSFLNAKIGLEATLEEGDNIEECYHKLSEEVKALARKEQVGLFEIIEPANEMPQQGWTSYTPPKNTVEERRIGDIDKDIRSCKDVRVLETYRLLVKKNPEFKPVYDEMHEKLSKVNQQK